MYQVSHLSDVNTSSFRSFQAVSVGYSHLVANGLSPGLNQQGRWKFSLLAMPQQGVELSGFAPLKPTELHHRPVVTLHPSPSYDHV